MGTVESFVRLFRGRSDVIGSWEGGCIREQLTPGHFERHLFSHDPSDWIGVYPTMGTWCSWGCIDIDQNDPAHTQLALNIRVCLAGHDVPSWIERTTRGYHVWTFPFGTGRYRGVVEARMMRRALRAACLEVGYEPKEVNPKQDQASGTSVGNYVRLPLNGSHANPAPDDVRRFIHNDVTLQEMDQWRVETTALHDLSRRCPDDPQPVDIAVDLNAGLEAEDHVYQFGKKVVRLWRDGPMYGHDRSNTLHRLAYELAEQDADPSTAWSVLLSADLRWGKFAARGAGGIRHLRNILDRAYAKAGVRG